MTDQEINIAIAQACGMELRRLIHDRQYATREMALDAGEPSLEGCLVNYEEWEQLEPPDYCHDLNAMHEAEETLRNEQKSDYVDTLFQLLPGEDKVTPSCFTQVRATARQRAEAFLRVKGLWKE